MAKSESMAAVHSQDVTKNLNSDILAFMSALQYNDNTHSETNIDISTNKNNDELSISMHYFIQICLYLHIVGKCYLCKLRFSTSTVLLAVNSCYQQVMIHGSNSQVSYLLG